MIPGFEAPEGGFAAWLEEHFDATELADPAISGPSADADGDGILNLVEYALGGNPRIPGTANLPQVAVLDFPEAPPPGDYLTISIRRPTAIDDIDYLVEASAALASWAADPILESVQDHGDGTATHLYRDTEPLSGNARRFLRLRVELK